MYQNAGSDLFLALDKIGVSNLSDDECCQLLVWFHNDRGRSEDSVHNWALNRDLKIAQQRLNVFGGENPNVELLCKFNEFREELEQSENKPDWFSIIEQKYNLKS